MPLPPRLPRRYYVALEGRAYLLTPDDLMFLGRPEIAVVQRGTGEAPAMPPATTATAVLEVHVPMEDEVEEVFLEIREVTAARCVTVVELLSPVKKLLGRGRETYLQKRSEMLRTRTRLVELDLLRAGEPMPVVGRPSRWTIASW